MSIQTPGFKSLRPLLSRGRSCRRARGRSSASQAYHRGRSGRNAGPGGPALRTEEPVTVRFTLNGRPVAIEPAPGESLLDALRERCGVVSVKDGCQPQGQCGCCLALIDGRPLVTCAFEAVRAEGRDVPTLEGVTAAEREVAAKA